MPTVTYLRTEDAGQEPDRKAVSVINVDGQEVQVTWWPSLLDQMPKEEVRAYVEAEALWTAGHYQAARDHLAPLASGVDTRTYDAQGNVTGGEDTRNWASRWVDEHPDPPPVEPVTDPLL